MPTHWPGVLVDGDEIQDMPIEVGKFPRVYYVMELASPGMVTGQPLTDRNPEIKIHIKGDLNEISNFVREIGVDRFEMSSTLEWAPFV